MAFIAQKKPSKSRATRDAPTSRRSGPASSPAGHPRFLRAAAEPSEARAESEAHEAESEPETEIEGERTTDAAALPWFLRARQTEVPEEPESIEAVKPTTDSGVGRAFGGEDDGEDPGGADDEGELADSDADGDATGADGAADGDATGAGAVQQQCSACGAEREPKREPVQQKCSACGGEVRRAPVQHKCSACEDESRVQQSTLPTAAVQQKCSACDDSPIPTNTVQMWDCTEYSQPRCSRERTPVSTIVQTKCAACEAEERTVQPKPDARARRARRTSMIHREAQRGLRGAGQPLPHLDRIQAAFGRHDVRSIRTQTGADARVATTNMGALAFTSGERIAFRDPPSLHLAAHEAAHTIQQRAGISLPEGVGTVGDRWERHADRVADAVVAGRSAEPILDEVAPSTSAAEPASRPRADEPERGSTEAPGTTSPTTDAPSEAPSSSANSTASEGLVQQARISSGAWRHIERAPQPVAPVGGAAQGQAPAPSNEGEGSGEGETEPSAAAQQAGNTQDACPPQPSQPTESSTPAEDPPVDVGQGLGPSACFDGPIRQPPGEPPEPDADAPSPPQKPENHVAFPRWDPPNDRCDCAALEAARPAGGGGASREAAGAGAGAGGAGGAGAPAPEPSKCTDESGSGESATGSPAPAADAGAVTAAGGGGAPAGEQASADASSPEMIAAIAKRESARDQAADKYTESVASIGRMSLRARRLGRGLRFKTTKNSSARANSTALATLRKFAGRASEQMLDALEFAEQTIPEDIASAANDAKKGISAAIDIEKGNVSDRIDAARDAARDAATNARSQVEASYLSAVATATTKTIAAIGKLTAERATSTATVSQRRETGLNGLNALFSTWRILHNLRGETEADAAITTGNNRASAWESCKHKHGYYGDDGFFEGCLTVRRAHAQQKAACTTSKATADNMVTTAMRYGHGLVEHRKANRCALISAAGQTQTTIDALHTQLTQGLTSSLQSTLTSLAATRAAKLAAIDAALTSTLRDLSQQEHTQRQAINDSGYMQEVAVEELVHTSAEGLVSGIDLVLQKTEKEVKQFLDKLTAGEPPEAEKLAEAIASADEGLENGLGAYLEKMREGLESSTQQIGKSATNAAKSLAEITKANDASAKKIEQDFSDKMNQTVQEARTEIDSIRDKQVCKAEEGQTTGVTGMQKAVKGFGEAVAGIFGKALEACLKSYTELGKDLDKQKNRLNDEITRNAYLAAEKEQPAWVDVVAVLLIIVVIALSIVASVLTAGLAAGPLAILIGIAVGAVVGAISAGLIQIINNWRTGERDLTKGVGRAMIMGAVGGALGGGFSGLGGVVAGAVIREGMKVATRVVINVAINMTADLLAEAATQTFAYFAYSQKFQLSGFVTAAITSGITSARAGAPKGRVAGDPAIPRSQWRPPGGESAGSAIRGLRPRGSDLALGMVGSAVAERVAMGESPDGKFDFFRMLSGGVGMVGASSSARHGAARQRAADAASTPRPTTDAPSGAHAPEGGTTPRGVGADAPESTTPRPTEGGDGTPRPTDAGAAPDPRARAAGGSEAQGTPRPTETGTTPRPGDAGAPPARAQEAGGTPRPDADASGRPTPRAGEGPEGGAKGRATEAGPEATAPRDGEAPSRPTDPDADLVTPGASRPVEIGDGTHTVAAKRTPSGDVVLTLCSACSRMSTRLDALAASLPDGSPARARMGELSAEVKALENRIRNGEIAEADIPEAVSTLAGKIQQAAGEHPSTVGRSLDTPDFDPEIVAARERARLENQAGFAKIESSLGEPVPPLPKALEADYLIDVNGVIRRRPVEPPATNASKIQLTNADGRVEVHSERARPTPTLDAEYRRTGLSDAETAELNRIRNTPESKRTDADRTRLAELRNKSSAVDLNDGVGASLRGDARPLTDAETADLARLRDSKTRTPEETQRMRELESRQRAREAAELIATRGDQKNSQAQRNKATEKLGELGSDEFVARAHPDSEKVFTGSGAGQLDGVYRNAKPPPAFIVAEAKGGSATNSSTRAVGDEHVQQGRRDYLESVLSDPRMRNADPKLVAELRVALAKGDLLYIEVTQKVTASGGLGDIRAREYDIGPRPTQPTAGATTTTTPRSTGPEGSGQAPRPTGGEGPQTTTPRPNAAETPQTTTPRPTGGGEGPQTTTPRPTGGEGPQTTTPRPTDTPETRPRSGAPESRPEVPATPPARPAEGETGPKRNATEPETSATAARRDEAATRTTDSDSDLVAPGASHPVGDHMMAAKRTPNGDVVITVCSACSRMSTRLDSLANEVPDAAATLRQLANEVRGLENQIRNKQIPEGQIPREVAAMARRIQAVAGQLPAPAKLALASPDFDPMTVRAREQARLRDPKEFARIEPSLGQPARPLPAALAGDYQIVGGRLVATTQGRPELQIIDGRIEVAGASLARARTESATPPPRTEIGDVAKRMDAIAARARPEIDVAPLHPSEHRAFDGRINAAAKRVEERHGLSSVQGDLNREAINYYVKAFEQTPGYRPRVTVHNGVIVEGHHRLIAAEIAGKPDQIEIRVLSEPPPNHNSAGNVPRRLGQIEFDIFSETPHWRRPPGGEGPKGGQGPGGGPAPGGGPPRGGPGSGGGQAARPVDTGAPTARGGTPRPTDTPQARPRGGATEPSRSAGQGERRPTSAQGEIETPTAAARRDAAASRTTDTKADLVTPGASHPVGEHTMAVKRTPDGDVVCTRCSNCTRMSTQLESLAKAEGVPEAAATKLRELAAEAEALESRIRDGDLLDTEIPGEVAALARRIQAATSEFPVSVKQALTGPDFDPAIVRAREKARVENPEGFAKIESSIGESAPPLPRALEGLYDLVNGRLVAKGGGPELAIVNGRIEVGTVSDKGVSADLTSGNLATGSEVGRGGFGTVRRLAPADGATPETPARDLVLKTATAAEGRDAHEVARSDAQISSEAEAYRMLEEAGVWTAFQAEAHFTGPSGRTQHGLVLDYIPNAVNSKELLGIGKFKGTEQARRTRNTHGQRVNEDTIQALESIRNSCLRDGEPQVVIGDLQFLIREDGQIRLIDPAEVTRYTTHPDDTIEVTTAGRGGITTERYPPGDNAHARAARMRDQAVRGFERRINEQLEMLRALNNERSGSRAGGHGKDRGGDRRGNDRRGNDRRGNDRRGNDRRGNDRGGGPRRPHFRDHDHEEDDD